MPYRPITLREPDDLDDVESLLSANGLPTADVHEKQGCFFVATAGGERVGIGGIEQYGTQGLLRSVVVAETHRGAGYGTALCETLEATARADGIETLYALTTTAADFFRGCGYEQVSRDRVPEQIQSTAEFAELCPATAICLRKPLYN